MSPPFFGTHDQKNDIFDFSKISYKIGHPKPRFYMPRRKFGQMFDQMCTNKQYKKSYQRIFGTFKILGALEHFLPLPPH